MTKKLAKIGNSYGVIFDKAVLDLLNIDKDCILDISTDGHRLILTPIKAGHEARVAEACDRMSDIHKETLQRLANDK